MGSLFGKKPKKPKGDPPPHAAEADRMLRDEYAESRVYTAMDAALGIRPARRKRQ